MTSVTREALCPVDFCPARNDPDWHHCVVCENNVIEHAHIEARSQRPDLTHSKGNVVALCHKHHELQTMNQWAFHVKELPWGGKMQWLTDERGETKWRRELPSGDSEDTAVTGGNGPSASPLGGLREEGRQPDRESASVSVSKASSSPPPYTFTDQGIEFEPEITFAMWVEAAKEIKHHNTARQWRLGDLVLAGDDRWEEAGQFTDGELGYPHETLAQFKNVSSAYPINERRSLPWSWHQSVAKHPERFALLDAALEHGWTRQELREAAGHKKPSKLQRWTLEELRERFDEFRCNAPDRYVTEFLDWLGGLSERTKP